MSENKIIKTVFKEALVEYEEKKSRFLTSVKPILSEKEALNFIEKLKKKHWDATHNVYAYHICGSNTIQRHSDDGEPSGTAGLPVMEAIKKMGVQDVVVVVTRYFGGTMLGAGGLIRAYGKSAVLGLEAALIIQKTLCCQVRLKLEYHWIGKIQSLLNSKDYRVVSSEYLDTVTMDTFIPEAEYEAFKVELADETNGEVDAEKVGVTFVAKSSDGKWIIPESMM